MDITFTKTLCLLFLVSFCEGLFVDYNCSSTYDPRTGIITMQEMSGTTCVWKFVADTNDNFVLEFLEFTSLKQLFTMCKTTYLEVKDGGTEDSPSIVGPNFCYIIQATAHVSTKTNGLWVKLQTDTFSHNNQLTAMVRIVSPSKRYQVYWDKLPWLESRTRCGNEGGSLAVNYPAPTIHLENEVFDSYSPLWTGMFLTDWVWLLGCVAWTDKRGIEAVYQNSKYNQVSECATMCKGALFFLLQEKSCYCFNTDTFMERVEFVKCDLSCPGNPREKCGGTNTFTQYQFSTLPVKHDDDGTNNCAALTPTGDYVAEACDIRLPFSCSSNNGTQTYTMALPWYEAIDFCSKQEGSMGLSTVPQISSDVFDEPIWLGLIRGLDWGYPSAIKRNPVKAFVAVEWLYGDHNTYFEELRNTSHSYPFVCQFERSTCGENLTTTNGNISSPNYPQPYGIDENCMWTISTQSVGFVYIIEFQHFDVENSLGCIYDFVQFTQVLNTDVKVKSQKYCGDKAPVPFVARTNNIELRLRSDGSVTSSGFILTWRLVNDAEAKKWEQGRKHPRTVNGGVVIGVTLATIFLVIFILCVVFVIYRARKKRMAVVQDPQSSVNNAIYGMDGSEFDETSVVNDNFRQYANINSPCKPLKEEFSYNYENMPGSSIAVGVSATEMTSRQSKENLYQSDASDTDERESNACDGEDVKSKTHSAGAEVINDGAILRMSDVDDIGKDAIQVVNPTESAEPTGDDMNDDYVPIEYDMTKTILKDPPNNVLYTELIRGDSVANRYQNTEPASTDENEVLNKNNDNAEAFKDDTEEYEEMDRHDFPGLNSPDHGPHGALIPQMSNVYTEIEETNQLKK